MRLLLFIALLSGLNLHAQDADRPKVIPHPMHMAIDSKDNIYVTMKYGIARVKPDGSFIDLRTLPGGQGIDFSMENIGGIVIDSKDNLWLGNGASLYKIKVYEDKIERINFAGYSINGSYGVDDGPVKTAKLQDIKCIAIDKDDNIYVTHSYDWIKDKFTGPDSYITDNYIAKVPKNKAARFFHYFRKITPNGMVTTIKSPDGKFLLANYVNGFVVNGDNLYYASSESRSVGKIDLKTGVFSTVAGKPYKRQYCPVYITGDTSKAELFTPGSMIADKNGGLVYSDVRSHRITRIANGKVSNLAGNNIIDPCSQNIGGRAQEGHKDGKAATALFNMPRGLAYDSKGNLFIADRHNMCIRKLSPDGMVSSFTLFDRSMAMIANY
jgi:hypothetical protein